VSPFDVRHCLEQLAAKGRDLLMVSLRGLHVVLNDYLCSARRSCSAVAGVLPVDVVVPAAGAVPVA